jgi:hypothetical protein
MTCARALRRVLYGCRTGHAEPPLDDVADPTQPGMDRLQWRMTVLSRYAKLGPSELSCMVAPLGACSYVPLAEPLGMMPGMLARPAGGLGGQGEKGGRGPGVTRARVLRLAKKAKWSQSERLIPSVWGMSVINVSIIELIRTPGRANDQASRAGQLLARLTSRGPSLVGYSVHSAAND